MTYNRLYIKNILPSLQKSCRLNKFMKNLFKRQSTKHKEIKFSKIEDDKKKLYRDAGLGLCISKKLVELLGGEIWVESEKDVVSIFYFTLPFSILAKNE
jgi:signal transduction histidine kinase